MTGIVCIITPLDITAFGVVANVRGIMREKMVGHTGTLDPMATGVLSIMLGGATRFLDYLPDSDKGYRATFILGKTTDTLDITGKVLSTCDTTAAYSDVVEVASKFKGEIEQIPPMYSAVSVDGKRLYDLARQGIEVERKSRRVNIKKLEITQNDTESYTIDVLCSKGTYIRTLIDDIGKVLGCGAVMTSLIRTQAMGFTLDDCVTLDELQRIKDSGLVFDSVVWDIEKILAPYDSVLVTQAQAKRFSNGGALDLNRIKKPLTEGLYRVYSPNGIFLGLGECDFDKNELRVKRLLVRNQ
ncbi:MAG: tRNA pseudouridine(55) synthase TruB [Clostridiales bacterium]|nr:tRNA pseudouridine(55) synthase TruB [Clostridiales bacterium]